MCKDVHADSTSPCATCLCVVCTETEHETKGHCSRDAEDFWTVLILQKQCLWLVPSLPNLTHEAWGHLEARSTTESKNKAPIPTSESSP